MDYNELDRRITIFPRVISQSLLKIIIDDNIVECNEAFNVTMTSVTTCGVTIGRNRSSEVIIRDNDGKYLYKWIYYIASKSKHSK